MLPLRRITSRLSTLRLVGHRDRFAEMRDRLLKGGATTPLIDRLAPPFDREIVDPGFSEMMRDHFWLRRGALGQLAQGFRGAAVQRLATTPKQAFVGRILDQRVLEAIVCLMACALGEEKVRFCERVERGLESLVVDSAHSAQQRIS